MGFTLEFLWALGGMLRHVLPLFGGLGLIISVLSIIVGRRENWSVGDSLYFGFITALTVGYGDLRPSNSLNKLLAVVIALFGLVTSGILVAVGIEAVAVAFARLDPA